jgi:DnaJ-class molecular chaperone
MQPTTETCRKCKGAGTVGKAKDPCPKCRGTGQFVKGAPDPGSPERQK